MVKIGSVVLFVAVGASTINVAGSYHWLGQRLLNILKQRSSESLTADQYVNIAEEIIASKGIYDIGIEASVSLVEEAFKTAEALPTVSIAQMSLRSSLVSLQSLLLGREKLRDIASSAISSPVDPKTWLSAQDTSVIEDQLEAVRIAESWDQLHSEYSPIKHDNVTVASVVAISSLWLHSNSDRFSQFRDDVEFWKFSIETIRELQSPRGFLIGDDVLRYSEFTLDKKRDVAKYFLEEPYNAMRYQVAKELLQLPDSHPVVSTITSTTTVAPPAIPAYPEFSELIELNDDKGYRNTDADEKGLWE